VDLAIGTANPNVDFIPGWTLHRDAGVPYVMDYRDAWRLDVFSGRTLLASGSRAGRWERTLQRGAAEVWFVNEAIRSWHVDAHPGISERAHVVANGYEQYDVPLAVPVRAERDKGLVFGYIGTVTDRVPLNALLEGWRRARARDPRMRSATLVIHGYAGHFGTSAAVARELALSDPGVRFEGPVSKSTIGKVYAGFDALVLLLGTGQYVTSGKVYEYAATGIPIAAIHDPSNAASEVLAASPARVATRSLMPDDISDALVETAALACSQTPADRARAQHWAGQYERSRQLNPRIDALTRLVTREPLS